MFAHDEPGPRGHVYFVRAGPFVKIGYSTDPRGRVLALETSSPVYLRPVLLMPGTKQEERAFHARFAAQRVRGEWFTYAGPIQEFSDSWDMRGYSWGWEDLV